MFFFYHLLFAQAALVGSLLRAKVLIAHVTKAVPSAVIIYNYIVEKLGQELPTLNPYMCGLGLRFLDKAYNSQELRAAMMRTDATFGLGLKQLCSYLICLVC